MCPKNLQRVVYPNRACRPPAWRSNGTHSLYALTLDGQNRCPRHLPPLSYEAIAGGGTQSRAKLNNDVVTEYAEAYKAGAKFPAVTVFFDGKDRWLADGFHRYFAAKQAGKTSILETVVPGTLRDAKFHSGKANQEHGQRRTNEHDDERCDVHVAGGGQRAADE